MEVSWYSSLKSIQIVGRCENRFRQKVPEFTSDEKVKILINSSNDEVDTKGMRVNKKSCSAKLWKGESMHSASLEEK